MNSTGSLTTCHIIQKKTSLVLKICVNSQSTVYPQGSSKRSAVASGKANWELPHRPAALPTGHHPTTPELDRQSKQMKAASLTHSLVTTWHTRATTQPSGAGLNYTPPGVYMESMFRGGSRWGSGQLRTISLLRALTLFTKTLFSLRGSGFVALHCATLHASILL